MSTSNEMLDGITLFPWTGIIVAVAQVLHSTFYSQRSHRQKFLKISLLKNEPITRWIQVKAQQKCYFGKKKIIISKLFKNQKVWQIL